MKAMAIRDLKNNPSQMTHFLEENQSVFITKHNRPIGVTLPLNDDLLSVGIRQSATIDQYRHGLISLGKMAELLGIDKSEAIRLVDRLGIDWLEYTADELETQLETANACRRA